MKKIVSLFLAAVMMLSLLSITVFSNESEHDEVTVYVTVSQYGEIKTDKNGAPIAMIPVTLSGQETYILDDAFKTLHEELCEAGLDGYETAVSDYGNGLYVSKFWNDTSGNFTYQVNFGEEDVWGPTHEVEQGDYVEFFINENTGLDMEVYTKFNEIRQTVQPGEMVDLMLLQGEYTGEGLSFFPCPDATITVNGLTTESITDAEGKAPICFEERGEYVVSAVKTKLLLDETVTAIEAPVCVITVQEDEVPPADIPSDIPDEEPEEDLTVITAEEQIDNIVKKYLNENIINDGNLCWFVADFADYLTVCPQSQSFFTDTQKQSWIDTIIGLADSSSSQGELAKAIIALRALGYDAKNTYRKDGTAFNVVEKLVSLVTEESVQEPYYEYTLPYVLIALQQGMGYAPQETTDLLISAAIETKSAWQDTSWGIDGAAPMLRALAPYGDANAEIKALIDETAELMMAYQGNDGSMGNAASTGLAMAGLSAIGINPETVMKNEKSLIDGLMIQTNETFDGFLPDENSFSTEQGLRGLIAWKLCGDSKMIYDFKDYPQNEARATIKKPSKPVWSGGGVSSVKKDTNEKEDASEAPSVEEKPQGLSGKNEDVQIVPVVFSGKTFNDVQNHENQKAIEELTARGIINGKTDEAYCPGDTMTRAELATILVRALGLPEKVNNIFDDVSENDWYYVYVNTAYSYGIINGVSERAFLPGGEITREETATMLLRAAILCGMNADFDDVSVRNILAEFSDYVQSSDWAKTALAFCFNEKIFDQSVIEINPKTAVTRAEVAQALYNMLMGARLV